MFIDYRIYVLTEYSSKALKSVNSVKEIWMNHPAPPPHQVRDKRTSGNKQIFRVTLHFMYQSKES